MPPPSPPPGQAVAPLPPLRQGFSQAHARTPHPPVSRMQGKATGDTSYSLTQAACVCPALLILVPPIIQHPEAKRHLRNVAPLNTLTKPHCQADRLHLQPVPVLISHWHLPSCAPTHDSCRDSTARTSSFSDRLKCTRRNLLREPTSPPRALSKDRRMAGNRLDLPLVIRPHFQRLQHQKNAVPSVVSLHCTPPASHSTQTTHPPATPDPLHPPQAGDHLIRPSTTTPRQESPPIARATGQTPEISQTSSPSNPVRPPGHKLARPPRSAQSRTTEPTPSPRSPLAHSPLKVGVSCSSFSVSAPPTFRIRQLPLFASLRLCARIVVVAPHQTIFSGCSGSHPRRASSCSQSRASFGVSNPVKIAIWCAW